jgi:hypothetical protein
MRLARRAFLSASLAALACVASTVSVAAAPAAGCAHPGKGDINGDGHADAVVTDSGDPGNAGAIHVIYGTAKGLTLTARGSARDDQRFTQNSPGVPDVSERGDMWGETLAVADFDDDGCADVAVGAPQESEPAPDVAKPAAHIELDFSPGEDRSVGRVTILYGSPRGLTSRGAQTVAQRPPELRLPGPDQGTPIPGQPAANRAEILVPGVREEEDRFGSALTTGDFDGDGVADLAIAAAGEALEPDRSVTGVLESVFGVRLQQGAVSIVYGSRGGLGQSRESRTLTHDDRPISGTPAYNDRFGEAIAAGDFNRDGVSDLVVSAPGVSDPLSGLKGIVQVFPGLKDAGVGGVPVETFNRGTRGVPGSPREEEFGYTLATGNLDGRLGDDLAIGTQVPGGAGAVVVLYSSGSSGLSGSGSQVWTQAEPGVPGRASVNDRFGTTLTIGRFGGPGTADDLAVGALNDGIGGVKRGSVTVLFGGPRGLTASRALLLHHEPRVSRRVNDFFGSAVAALPVRRSGFDDLLIGSPNVAETGLSTDATGAFQEIPMGPAGPHPLAGRRYILGTPGLTGTPFVGARLGCTIS